MKKSQKNKCVVSIGLKDLETKKPFLLFIIQNPNRLLFMPGVSIFLPSIPTHILQTNLRKDAGRKLRHPAWKANDLKLLVVVVNEPFYFVEECKLFGVNHMTTNAICYGRAQKSLHWCASFVMWMYSYWYNTTCKEHNTHARRSWKHDEPWQLCHTTAAIVPHPRLWGVESLANRPMQQR